VYQHHLDFMQPRNLILHPRLISSFFYIIANRFMHHSIGVPQYYYHADY